jgi:hypothetical protein
MIQLKKTDFKNLQEFYDTIRLCHENAHGKDYTAQHDVIKDKAAECQTYRELGIMQGATAAAAALAGYEKLHLIDINIDPFEPYISLFDSIKSTVTVEERSSITFKLNELEKVDFLLIDSLHKENHLRRELAIHAPRVNKYILFHDTFEKPELQEVIDKFIKNNITSWELEEYYQKNVGYTLIKRIGNAG